MPEFVGAAALLEKWVGRIDDPVAEFKEIDKDDGGTIAFDEFCDWCVHKNLDIDEGDGFEADFGNVDITQNNLLPF